MSRTIRTLLGSPVTVYEAEEMAAAIAREREACAKIVESHMLSVGDERLGVIARLIRARPITCVPANGGYP